MPPQVPILAISSSAVILMFDASPDEDWVLDPGVIHELDDLVEEDPCRGYSHPVGDGEHGPHLIHGVPGQGDIK